jgi:hypothetical protein
MNVEKIGDVEVHRVQLAAGFIDLFDRYIGAGRDVFIGVGPERIWLAAGTGCREKLKETINGLGEPRESDTPLHIEIKMLPWVQRLEEVAKTEPPGKTAEELESQREWARRRARAIESFSGGNDSVVIDFKAVKDEIKGEIFFETGLLQMAGKMISAFSKTNFE